MLVRGSTEERQFAQWSMAFADLTESDTALAAQSRSFLHDEDDELGGGTAGVGRRLLLSFRRTLENRSR